MMWLQVPPSKIQTVLSVFVLGLTGLTHLDLFGARITDSGTNHLRSKFLMFIIYIPILRHLPHITFCWFSI